MKRQPRILAGTALGLLMASAPLGAFPLQQGQGPSAGNSLNNAPVILAQAGCAEGQSAEECAAQGGGEQPRRQQRRQQQEEAQPEAPAEAAPSEQEQPRRQQRRQQQEEAQPEAPAEAAPSEQEQPRRQQRRQQQEEAQPEAPAEAAPAEQEQPRRQQRRQQQEEAQPEAPAEAAPAEQEQPRRQQRRQQQEETKPEAPAEAAPAEQQERPRGQQREQAEPAPADKAAPAEGAAPAENAPTENPASGQGSEAQPKNLKEFLRKKQQGEETTEPARPAPNAEQPAPAGEQPAPTGEQPAAPGATPTQRPAGEQPAEGGVQGEAPAQDPNAAPVLDSQKERPAQGEAGRNGGQAGEQGGQTVNPPPANEAQQPAAPVEQGPPPADDKAAQEAIQPEKIVPVTEEKGERRERPRDIRDRERPRGADVIEEVDNRLVIQFNNQTIVESSDRPRMTRNAREVYYEDLPRGRTREIIERPNGVKVITIRNANGDIIRRSRIGDDGREYVLNYVDETYYDDVREWRDPGEDLPPLRLSIPRTEYILESESVEAPEDYYEFLEQPPIEKVQRLYSVDEVKRSARVRDIARRIDLDTLNFEFGSADIPESEADKLQGVAEAMLKMLEKNPAETFLIEGHTDAVGSDSANLVLSDKRAESVAAALTEYFQIPPENLTTQGYGESYLKVNTSGPERENRRVAIRRITPLVAPVASAQ